MSLSYLNSLPRSPTLKIKSIADELKKQGKIFDFGIGEMNPTIPTPNAVKTGIVRALDEDQTSYSNERGDLELRTAISNDLKRNFGLDYDVSQICVTAGPKDALFKAMMSLLDPTEARNRVVSFSPCYESFLIPPMIFTRKETIILETDQNCFPILENLESTLQTRDDIAMIIINSPNNPAGIVYPKELLQKMAQIIQKYPQIIVLSDEVYRTIKYDTKEGLEYSSIAHFLPNQTIVVGGMSKEISGTGLRVGFAAGPSLIIETMAFLNGHSIACVNLATQKGYAHFLNYDTDLKERLHIRDLLDQKRRVVVKCFKELEALKNCDIGLPNGAFYVFPNISYYLDSHTPEGEVIKTDEDLCLYLLKEGKVVLIPGSSFKKPGYFRLAYAASTLQVVEEGLISLNNTLLKLKK